MYTGRFKTQPNEEISMMSQVLSRALDRLGANQLMRQRYYESCMISSLVSLFLFLTENGTFQQNDSSDQYFGSQIEGTRTVGMRSDIDSIHILADDVIEENVNQTYNVNIEIVIVIADMFTPPGYVKLKVHGTDLNANFKLVKDTKGNMCISNCYTRQSKRIHFSPGVSEHMTEIERHGPALTNATAIGDVTEPHDIVIAYHCKSILSFTQEFFCRSRRFSWPSVSALNIMKGQGCLLVPKGHNECSKNQRNMQWRVSFSFQERHLMLNLNSTQFLCYILLKFVKTSHISPEVELTSYHCKTALFYTMENTASEIWKEENLLYCFILCLIRLNMWSKKHFCPNYFLPEINLFTGKIREKDMYKLTNILSKIIDSPQYYLRQIRIDNLGELIQLYELNSPKVGKELEIRKLELEKDKEVSEQLQKNLSCASIAMIQIKNIVLRKISYNCNDINEIIDRHYKWLKSLKELDSVNGFPPDGITWTLPHVSRFLHSSLGSHLGIKASDTDDFIMRSWYTVTTVYHLWMGLNSDSMSGRMKLATMLLFSGHLNSKKLKSLLKANFMTPHLCDCTIPFRPGTKCHFRESMFMCSCPRMQQLELNASQYLENYISTCTVFLPSESKLTLYPLQFERFRSVGCARHLLDSALFYQSRASFYDCATVDSNIYYILLNMYSSGKQKQKQLVEQMRECNSSDTFMHRETTWNILGWLASAEKINSASLLFLKRSWDYYAKKQNKNREVHQGVGANRNGAKWHVVLLLYRAWLVKNR